MRFQKLTVHNFGVFRGTHEFDLTHILQERQHNLTLFRGHNGAGKSTLFQAMALALQGSFVLGERVRPQEYDDYLQARFHRHTRGNLLVTCDKASVSLRFDYVRSGTPLMVAVTREWERNGSLVNESLSILVNGEPPDVHPDDYQLWLNDLIPPGVALLCFFDAEQLSTLTQPSQHSEALREMVHRLFGLQLVEQLQRDLDYYLSRQGGSGKVEQAREEIRHHRAAIDFLDSQLEGHEHTLTEWAEMQQQLERELAKQEARLASQGGRYAARRAAAQERLTEVQKEIDSASNHLRDLANHLLPFALAPELAWQLSQQLAREAHYRLQRQDAEGRQRGISQVQAVLEAEEEKWDVARVAEEQRAYLTKWLVDIMKAELVPEVPEVPLIHNLSDPEREQMAQWIEETLHTVPEQTKALGDQLRTLREEQTTLEKTLQRAPKDEALAPLHAEITALQQQLTKAKQAINELTEQVGAARAQRKDAERHLEQAVTHLEKQMAGERQIELAVNSRAVLRVYQEELLRQRLAQIEQGIVVAFNALCQKDYLLKSVQINPDDFSVQLHSADGHLLSLNDFSAGERQLYALALLQTLRDVSQQALPLLIDTPMARLDEAHRRRFLHDYLPRVSDQVLLFATDMEITTDLLADLQPQTARLYHLSHNPEQATVAVADEHPPLSTSLQSANLISFEQIHINGKGGMNGA